MRANGSDGVVPTMTEIDQHFCEEPLTSVQLWSVSSVGSKIQWGPLQKTKEAQHDEGAKTWLRSDARLTWLAVYAIHKNELDSVDLETVANKFINIKPGSEKVFGRFKVDFGRFLIQLIIIFELSSNY